MLIIFVGVYLLVTIGIGLWAARRVHSAKDYLVAGRSLPLYMNVATVFATWFGAETVLSVSATFAKDGLVGIPGDPFGATVCLVIAALLFARYPHCHRRGDQRRHPDKCPARQIGIGLQQPHRHADIADKGQPEHRQHIDETALWQADDGDDPVFAQLVEQED